MHPRLAALIQDDTAKFAVTISATPLT
jgi:hypothetical protein